MTVTRMGATESLDPTDDRTEDNLRPVEGRVQDVRITNNHVTINGIRTIPGRRGAFPHHHPNYRRHAPSMTPGDDHVSRMSIMSIMALETSLRLDMVDKEVICSVIRTLTTLTRPNAYKSV